MKEVINICVKYDPNLRLKLNSKTLLLKLFYFENNVSMKGNAFWFSGEIW